MQKLKSYSVSIDTKIFKISGTWKPDKKEKEAAWEMYVELITRISTVELKSEEGLLSEALRSLYSIFQTTREILRKYGSSVAISKKELSFGSLAVSILNKVLRPILAYWHPILQDYEYKRNEKISPLEHEKNWKKNEDLRKRLNQVREAMVAWAKLLEQVAEIPSLIEKEN